MGHDMSKSNKGATVEDALKLVDDFTRIYELVEVLFNRTSFPYMPASVNYHNNYLGGLKAHSVNVLNNLMKLTTELHLSWERPSSPFIIAMLHDACKIDAYKLDPDAEIWMRNEDHPDGHGSLSLKVAADLGIELTREEKACIRWHMGAFDDKANWSQYTNAIHEYPNVLWVHTADMMATHIDEIKPQGGTHEK